MPSFFRTVSGIALLAIAALFALQAFPYTGLFLMIFGGAMLVGLLVHVFLIGLFVEASMGRVPHALIAIPIIAYAGYYALYTYQTIDIRQKSAQLRKENSSKIFDFDPEVYSLVTLDAQTLVGQYAIPVAYQPNKNVAIGCGLISGGTPAWKCFADFVRSHIAIDTVPDVVDHEKYELPERVMLGTPKYTAADLADFRGFKQNDEALRRVAEEPKRVEDDSFALLKQIVEGKKPDNARCAGKFACSRSRATGALRGIHG